MNSPSRNEPTTLTSRVPHGKPLVELVPGEQAQRRARRRRRARPAAGSLVAAPRPRSPAGASGLDEPAAPARPRPGRRPGCPGGTPAASRASPGGEQGPGLLGVRRQRGVAARARPGRAPAASTGLPAYGDRAPAAAPAANDPLTLIANVVHGKPAPSGNELAERPAGHRPERAAERDRGEQPRRGSGLHETLLRRGWPRRNRATPAAGSPAALADELAEEPALELRAARGCGPATAAAASRQNSSARSSSSRNRPMRGRAVSAWHRDVEVGRLAPAAQRLVDLVGADALAQLAVERRRRGRRGSWPAGSRSRGPGPAAAPRGAARGSARWKPKKSAQRHAVQLDLDVARRPARAAASRVGERR